MRDVKHELVKAIVHATEAAGLWSQSRFLAAIGMPESWIRDAIDRPDEIPLDEYVRVYDQAAEQAGWLPLAAIVREITDRQRRRGRI